MHRTQEHVLVLDVGTTSTRAVLYGHESEVLATTAQELGLESSGGGRVEQDAEEIYERSVAVLREIAGQAQGKGRRISTLAIAAQRTSTVLWDKRTGKPVAPVYSWQDTRTAPLLDELRPTWGDRAALTTGMVLNCSTPLQLSWMLRDPELQRRAQAGELLAGTVDSWLVWRFTGGPAGGRHVTSASCAGSTGMLDLTTETWWSEFLDALQVPTAMLAQVLPEDGDYGTAHTALAGVDAPITGVVGDQQSALFGQGGLAPGAVKCTHGTGSFIDFNIGSERIDKLVGLDCRVGWRTATSTANVIEGGTFVSGSAVEWMIHKAELLTIASELDATYDAADPRSGVVVVPTLAGFAAPHWDEAARGAVFGMHRGTTRSDLVRATVDGIAHTVADLLETMSELAGVRPQALHVDGGLSKSDRLLQFQADILQVPVVRAANPGFVTALGAAHIAGLSSGLWADQAEAAANIHPERTFEPGAAQAEISVRRAAWHDAVGRSLGWRDADWAAA